MIVSGISLRLLLRPFLQLKFVLPNLNHIME